MKTKTQGQEGRMQEKVLITSRRSLEGINMTPNSQPKPVMHMILCRIWSTPQPKEPHRSLHVIWIWDVTFQVQKEETDHKKLHRGQISRRG